ncbi:MAG: protein kinase [Polyangiaceae bacterium]
MADDEPPALIGRTIAGKFLVEERVGSGAMGDVYRARHATLDTVIAIKIMRPDLAKDEMFRERFYREAKAASKLEHVNSVRVIDYGHDDDGLIYLAMEFLAGRDLLTVLREDWPLSDERVVSIVSQTLAAVSVAHELGIVHRDLKPENIMVLPNPDDLAQHRDIVKVCDFGIAKLNDPRAFQTEGGGAGKALTTSGTLIGTPEYMSPEQARGDPLDARSDIYSVGVILYQMLTGRVPFTAENMLGVVLKHVTDEPAPPSSMRAGVHGRLEAICLRALRKKREERYQTAREMRADLKKALGSDPRVRFDSVPELPSSPGSVVVRPTGTLVTGDRATMPVDSRPQDMGSGHHRPDFSPKQTSDGTELSVAAPSRSKMTVGVVIAFVALAVGAGSVVLYTKRLAQTDTGPSASASAPVSATTKRGHGKAPQPTAVKHTTSPSASATEPAPDATSSSSAGPVAVTAPPPATTGGHVTRPATSTAPIAAPSAGVAATTSASASAAPVASVAPTATATAPAGPPYDPTRAYVELGMLNATGVQVAAVRGRMRQLQPTLSACYRQGLAQARAPIGGTPTIHLSIDASGRLQPTITGADRALASAVHCMQRAVAGQSVGAAAVQGAGATAEQWLTLHP